ncbi:LLM class flavin-dependent oxidoreductase [Micromonospora sp. PLK6-60]|uniref:LLM class flavin-dependent oxidoreductase n=1 Tax=Micromonospora sp. PLK6-60 TaxID=2873383 RepID=UPI001CA6082B|nr:LLM class flavin-dependent oxidoreductase [Micromonospora sp. PLK6-60]MBY8873780.1 LLM class flavin-dependent oxidoreductase [Micromonospora sp. PLK6-60]
MAIELGIVLDLPAADGDPAALVDLARQAESAGLDLVALRGEAGAEQGLDPWTTAVWLAGRTTRIPIGIAPDLNSPDPGGPGPAYPSVVAKAQQSLEVLAGTRFVTPDAGWVVAPPDAGAEHIRRLADAGAPVVVPARSAEDVRRIAGLVAKENRPAGRSAAVRARRRAGIDYDGVPASLADVAIEPGDPAYRRVTSTYLRGGSPGLVLRPRTSDEVADAVAFARRHRQVPLGLRSGGHGISGRSTNDGGLVIDVGALNGIEVLDAAQRLVRIGPGATWKQVAAALDPYGWALGSGDYGGVGVGGLATAGGIGYLSRRYGLTIDRLRAVELVLADGSRVRTSKQDHADLFWAVRGAGANFGVATAFEFEVSEVRQVGWAQLVLVSTDLEQSLRRYGELTSAAPRDTTVFLVTGRPRQGRSVIQLYAMVDQEDPEVIIERLTPFTELGALAQQQVVRTSYKDVMALAADVGPDGHQGMGEPVSRSAFLPALTGDVARDVTRLLRSGLVYFFELRSMGGAIADTPADETAFAHRTPAFQVTAMGADQSRLNAAWDGLGQHFDGLYLSFDTDLRPQRLGDAFPPRVLSRLRELKRRYDPDNLFRDNFNIDPRLTEEHTR